MVNFNRISLLIYSIVLSHLVSCENEQFNYKAPSNKSKIDYYQECIDSISFDTTVFLDTIQLQDQIEHIDLIKIDTNKELQEKVDTFTLTYIQFACYCQNWVIDGQYEGDMLNNSFYLEPANEDLKLPEIIHWTGNKVQFIGRVYKEIQYPHDSKKSEQVPPKGEILRYYAYKIIKPYKIWGPRICGGIHPHTGEALTYPNLIKIEE